MQADMAGQRCGSKSLLGYMMIWAVVHWMWRFSSLAICGMAFPESSFRIRRRLSSICLISGERLVIDSEPIAEVETADADGTKLVELGVI